MSKLEKWTMCILWSAMFGYGFAYKGVIALGTYNGVDAHTVTFVAQVAGVIGFILAMMNNLRSCEKHYGV